MISLPKIMLQSVLVAVDGSDANRLAADMAIDIAKDKNVPLTAICVFDIGSYSTIVNFSSVDQAQIDKMEEDALVYIRGRAAEKGVDLRTKTVTGKPVEAIVAEAANHQLVVCGTHGRTGISHSVIGSVAERLVRLAPCPVLVVRDTQI